MTELRSNPSLFVLLVMVSSVSTCVAEDAAIQNPVSYLLKLMETQSCSVVQTYLLLGEPNLLLGSETYCFGRNVLSLNALPESQELAADGIHGGPPEVFVNVLYTNGIVREWRKGKNSKLIYDDIKRLQKSPTAAARPEDHWFRNSSRVWTARSAMRTLHTQELELPIPPAPCIPGNRNGAGAKSSPPHRNPVGALQPVEPSTRGPIALSPDSSRSHAAVTDHSSVCSLTGQ